MKPLCDNYTDTRRRLLIIQESMGGGGAERALISLLHRLDRARFDIRLLLVKKGGPLSRALPADIPCQALFGTRTPRGLWRLPDPLLLRLLRRRALRALGTFRPQTVLSFIEGEAVAVHRALLQVAPRHLSWLHTDIMANPWTRPILTPRAEGDFYRRADKVICVSGGAADSVRRLYSLPGRKVEVVHNIIDPVLIRARAGDVAPKPGPLTIVAVGRLVGVKRFDRLLRAAANPAVSGFDFRINILGDGPERENLTALAARLGLAGRVSFKGFLENPYPDIAAADLFVLPSDAEGYSLVVAEALALGRPVVSTRVTGPDELLAGGAGILTDLTDEALARAMGRVCADPALRSRLSAAAYARARDFEPERIAARVADLLDPPESPRGKQPTINT